MTTKIPPVTGLALLFLVTVSLLHSFTGEFKTERHTVIPEHSLDPARFYRFFTAPFVHKDLLYLSLVLVTLAILGSNLERKLGTMTFFFTLNVAWFGSVLLFSLLGMLFYFLTGYDSWMEAKQTGFAPILFALAVVDSYIGTRDMVWIVAPWPLVLIVPLLVSRLSTLSCLAGALFGLMLARGLGRAILPDRESALEWESSWLGRKLHGSWTSFCPVWPSEAEDPLVQSQEGSMCSDRPYNITGRESQALMPISSTFVITPPLRTNQMTQVVSDVVGNAKETAKAVKNSAKAQTANIKEKAENVAGSV